MSDHEKPRNETPTERLDRIARHDRLKEILLLCAFFIGVFCVIWIFIAPREPQGPETATVLSHSQVGSYTAVVVAYQVELASGETHVIRARPILGLKTGDILCVQRMRHPIFGGERLQRLRRTSCDGLGELP